MSTQTRNELAKAQYVTSLFTPPGATQMLGALLSLIMIVLSWYSITVEVFFRRQFGERYLSFLRILLAYMTFQTYQTFYYLILFLFGLGNPMNWFWNTPNFGTIWAGGVHSFLYHVFIYCFLGLSIVHQIAISKREHEGTEWHTMSFGISWLEYLPWHLLDQLLDTVFLVVGNGWRMLMSLIPLPIVRNTLQWLVSLIPFSLVRETLRMDDWKLYRFIEPALCFIAGQTLRPVDGLLGTWLLIASVALFVKNNMVYFDLRSRVMDSADSHIEGTYLQAALKQTDKRQTAGFSVVPVAMNLEGIAVEEMNIAATVEETLRQPATLAS